MGFLKAQIRRIEVTVKAFDFFFLSAVFGFQYQEANKVQLTIYIVCFVNTQETMPIRTGTFRVADKMD